MNATENISIVVPSEALGPPGIRNELLIVASRLGESRTDEERLKDARERPFQVDCLLAKQPPAYGNDPNASFDSANGSSYFRFPRTADRLELQTTSGKILVRINANNEASLLTFECLANSATTARHRFLAAVSPFLDHLSYVTNCPAFIASLRVQDRDNDITVMSYVGPYRYWDIGTQPQTIYNELLPIYSLYRESHATSSAFYKFLCIHKILEGIYTHLRPSLYKRAREKNVTLPRVIDTIPKSGEIHDHYAGYVGKSAKIFMDEVMTPKFRNAIAHFLLDDGKVLSLSDPVENDRFANVMLISELAARAAISNQEILLDAFSQYVSS